MASVWWLEASFCFVLCCLVWGNIPHRQVRLQVTKSQKNDVKPFLVRILLSLREDAYSFPRE